MALVPIILSGGAGARLWPLSREAAPKPFLPLPADGADGDTLLARTFLRAVALPDVAGIVTVTNRDYYFQTRDAYACLTTHVGECSVSIVVIEAGRPQGAAQEQVGVSIIVKVPPASPDGGPLLVDPRLFGDFGKGPVAVVAVQTIRSIPVKQPSQVSGNE